MSDVTFDFTALATASPATPPANMAKPSGYLAMNATNTSGIRSSSNGGIAGWLNDIAYTGGSTEILSEIDTSSIAFNGDVCIPAVMVRTGANRGAGYAAYFDGAGVVFLWVLTTSGVDTQIGVVGSITLAANDRLGIGYTPSTHTAVAYQNGVARLSVSSDTTYSTEVDWCPGVISEGGNTNGIFIKHLYGTGVAVAAKALAARRLGIHPGLLCQ